MSCSAKFFSIWCIIVITIVQIKANYQCGIRKHSFVELIYHGWKVEEGQWPWHVGLHKKSENGTAEYQCGGTLIGQKHVLTAAHCVVPRNRKVPMPVEELLLHFGQNDLSTMAKQVQVRDVGKIVVHPEYSSHRNDIAVLELRLPVAYSDYVIPICLDAGRADQDMRHLKDQRGWITGWGMTQNGTLSSELRSASLPVVDYLRCVQNDPTLFGNLVNENVFCAGDRNGTSPGTGDSGGGMYFSDGDRWVLRGIVSFAKMKENLGQVDASKYAVFVNVQRFLSWIREVTEDENLNSTAKGVTRRISEEECDRFKNLTRKSNNRKCSNSRHPHTVSLGSGCTGILLNENHVLTTCRCAGEFKGNTVRLVDYGAVNVSSSVCHPAYKSDKFNDLAIFTLQTSIRLSSNVIPACLANNWTENLYDSLVSTGYRISSGDRGVSHFFESDANELITAEECNRILPTAVTNGTKITSAQLCAINYDRIATYGTGSTGSPLQTFNTRSCTFTVVGVFSAEYNVVAGPGNTAVSVFSRISHHLDWIEETVWGVKAVQQTSTTATMRPAPEGPTTRKYSPATDFVFPAD